MYTLYVLTGCQYCAKVKQAIARLNLAVEEKNIADSTAAEEVENLGGQLQAPYLYDHDAKMGLYGSEQIIRYLEEHATKA